MTTIPAYYQEPYRTELDAIVIAVDGEWVVLDRTLFYPEGGGQPGDSGMFITADGRELAVLDTRKGETPGTIRHRLVDAGHGLQPGDTLRQRLDWERRHRHMRMHTCLHLLCSLVPFGVTGGALSADKGRLDFDLGEDGTPPDKEELTERLNALIEAGYAVTTEWLEEAVLDSNPELVRTMSVQPPRGHGAIRMVRVEGVDFQPCGGTHVANTREIGRVLVSKIESKGKRNRRIVLAFAE